ncbi:alpha/beta hydrolase [Sphingobacterium sp.]|uniref:alpha/beta hydrolase n=1 Tax=Sphingobacterium sp. TaxID=341027 RepID=UPI0031E33BCD
MSGLGVDRRVFNKINFKGLKVTYLEWIAPISSESISCYARRLSTKITTESPVLIGLSFGGMVAMEIAKIIAVKRVILLASAKDDNELPKLYKLIGTLRLHRFIPTSILKSHHILSNYFFGVSSKEDKKLLKQILRDTDTKFLSWAINQIVNWKNKTFPNNLTHIHGSKDRIIPIRNVIPTFVIQGAGHFMTITHAKEIETLLQKILLKDLKHE